MSDEEDSMSEGFSASEDEWKPGKDVKGGESSDDDDSDFEGSQLVGAANGSSGTSTGKKKIEPKARSAAKQSLSKKRTGLSLRAKLYNKYRPPPKTFSPPSSMIGKNSPSASASISKSKNAKAPNESKNIKIKNEDGNDSDSSSDSSIDNYLVNPEDLDIQSSFFNVESKPVKRNSSSPVPVFDCNAGLANLSDSVSEEEGEGIKKEDKPFDFNNLLEYAKSLERIKESVAKHNAEESRKKTSTITNIDTLDVYSVLALGEKQQNRSHNDGEDENDEDDDECADNEHRNNKKSSKLSKTKSTRIKRHTKTRPTSTVAANDTDDSDWEEVADSLEDGNVTGTIKDISRNGNIEIHVDLPTRNRGKKAKTQEDIEMAFKRRLNRDIRERQLLLHKASFLCHFARLFFYNRLLNDPSLMSKALKLLPTKSAYPPEKGTEIKYFQSIVTWFKSVIILKTQNLYPDKSASKTKAKALVELLKQIEEREARSKQDMIFIFIILLRGMGLQCRLVVNIQPLPLKPATSDLNTIKMKTEEESIEKDVSVFTKKIIKGSQKSDTEAGTEENSCMSKNKKEREMEITSIKHVKNKAEKKDKIIKNIKKELSLEKQKESVGKEKSNCSKKTSSKSSKDNKTNSETESWPEYKNCDRKNAEEHNSQKKNKKTKSIATNVKSPKQNSNESNHMCKEKPNISKNIVSSEVTTEELENFQKENKTKSSNNVSLAGLKRNKATDNDTNEIKINKRPSIEIGSAVIPKIIVQGEKNNKQPTELPSTSRQVRNTRPRSKSPQARISTVFLLQNTHYKDKFPGIIEQNTNVKNKTIRDKSPTNKVKISADFMKNIQQCNIQKRVLRSRQKANEATDNEKSIQLRIPQLDGTNDTVVDNANKVLKLKSDKKKHSNTKKLKVKRSKENSDDDFEPSPPKKPKSAPVLIKQDRRVLSSDDDNDKVNSAEKINRKQTAGDMWLEVWCDVEEQWVCVDIFKGKIHCVDTIRKSASPNLAYVFAFQNDLSIKDVTARYCTNWTTVIRKSRMDKTWLDAVISTYLGHRTHRDIKEDEELRRIHEEKPMPTSISDYKNHPFYVLQRHLLKFEALYPPNAPALGYIRGEPIYSRDCVHTLHSREIWLKEAKTVKLGEKPYKIVKARPKWDRITQTVIKDQPLELFGYWQTQDYEPPTAENGLVPRNAYGNVELFKPSMLPKKTVYIRLPGLNRICRKFGIDCANAVVGFDFHQGSCHPTYDGFVVCEEFEDQVVAAWHQDQEEQCRKEQEKYEARVYGNWKKIIRGLLIRERLKLKYNF